MVKEVAGNDGPATSTDLCWWASHCTSKDLSFLGDALPRKELYTVVWKFFVVKKFSWVGETTKFIR